MEDLTVTSHTLIIVTNNDTYALLNYKEIINYYQLPFYKRWFTKKPVKEFIILNKN